MIDFTPLIVRIESVLAAYLLGGATAAGIVLSIWSVISIIATQVGNKRK
jgi:hypothetical protein